MVKANYKITELAIDCAMFAAHNGRKEFTFRDLCNFIQIHRTHPYLNQLLKELIEKEIVIKIRDDGKLKFFKINKRKIVKYVDTLPLVIKNQQYNREFHVLIL